VNISILTSPFFVALRSQEFQMHPEDHDSALMWYSSHSIFFSVLPIVLGIAYISLAIGTASVVSLKVASGVTTQLQAAFGYTSGILFLAFTLWGMWRNWRLKPTIGELRKHTPLSDGSNDPPAARDNETLEKEPMGTDEAL
jgi:hypothetical protein